MVCVEEAFARTREGVFTAVVHQVLICRLMEVNVLVRIEERRSTKLKTIKKILVKLFGRP